VKVKNLRGWPTSVRLAKANAVGFRDSRGHAYAMVHHRFRPAMVRTPHQARKIAAWLNDWADALEREVQRGSE
jgi:hypothetical protein